MAVILDHLQEILIELFVSGGFTECASRDPVEEREVR
jgi:hypothetical protein